MGRAGRWFRSLWGSKKPSPSSRERKGKWVLPKTADNSFRNDDPFAIEAGDANKHAIAVAAATAAVAEAALAAAHAAAEVVRLTSSSGGGSGRNVAAYISNERLRVSAAIKIQSAFRAYLARRALRALKALVKLQALVRGHIVRKQSADMLKRMQAMARIQARASAQRSEFGSSANIYMRSFPSHQPGAIHPRCYDRKMSSSRHGESSLKMQHYHPRSHTNSLDHWMEQSSWSNFHETNRVEDDRSDKILEIDTWMPRRHSGFNDRALHLPRYVSEQEYSKASYLSRLSSKTMKPNPSTSSEEAPSLIAPNFEDQAPIWTAESSPRVRSATSSLRGGSLALARTDCSRSLFGDYLSHPNYMANTESSRAKVRSQSVPKQRMQVETRNLWDNNDCISEKGFAPTADFGEQYLNSGYLKRQGSRPRGATNGIGSNSGYRPQDCFFYG